MSTLGTKEEMEQICAFRIAGYLYGVSIKSVKEINQELHISPVPHAPPYVYGLVNIRGEVYLIFDLRNCFGFPPTVIEGNHRIILFKSIDSELSGILVDEMEDVIRISTNRIESYDPDGHVDGLDMPQYNDIDEMGAKLVQGVYQLPKEVLIILNVQALFL